MSEFLRLIPPEEAWQRWLAAVDAERIELPVEKVGLMEALDRVLAEPVTATEALPPFERSTVDGYAVRASDTFGASESLPAYLAVIGEMPMGVIKPLALGKSEAALVHTGGALPEGADAVVMLEDTQQAKADELEVLRPAAAGENVLKAGEDLTAGELALPAGQRLRPQDLGGLAALGVTEVAVSAKPRVAIISSGDELVPPAAELGSGQVRDINSTTLAALIRQAGGEPVPFGIVSDEPGQLDRVVAEAKERSDILVITAGSSVSHRDRTAEVLDELGEPGVLVHGLSIKPGKPTILAVGEGTPAIGLPGNPVSALVIAGLLLTPLIRRLLGSKREELRPQMAATMTVNIASKSGREDHLPVRLIASDNGWQAEPVYGRSNLIFTLIRADGLVRIPPEVTGLKTDQPVVVNLF